jgi:hypothetical protein
MTEEAPLVALRERLADMRRELVYRVRQWSSVADPLALLGSIGGALLAVGHNGDPGGEQNFSPPRRSTTPFSHRFPPFDGHGEMGSTRPFADIRTQFSTG